MYPPVKKSKAATALLIRLRHTDLLDDNRIRFIISREYDKIIHMKDAVKALIKNQQGEILVLFRSETHPYLAHDIDLPGGEIDLNESVEDALMREVFEETELKIDIQNSRELSSWQTPWGQQHFLYECRLDSIQQIAISWEHESYAWMTEEEFVEHKAIDDYMHHAQNILAQSLGDDRFQKQPSLVGA